MSNEIITWEECRVKSKNGFIAIVGEQYNELKPFYKIVTYDKSGLYLDYLELNGKDCYSDIILSLVKEVKSLKHLVQSYTKIINA